MSERRERPNFFDENRRLHPTRAFFPGQLYEPEVCPWSV